MVDLEPGVLMMARLQRAFSGKEGEPTPEEIEKARQEMLRDAPVTPADLDFNRDEIAKELPPGTRLLDATATTEGLRFGVSISVAFDRVSRLAEIDVPSMPPSTGRGRGAPRGKSSGSPGGSLVDLKIIDTPTRLVLAAPLQNPIGEEAMPFGMPGGRSKGGPPDPETDKEVEQLLGGLRVGLRITAPFRVVTHNGHRRDGNTVEWNYGFRKIMGLGSRDMKQGLRIVYAK
jgi:hypothetical protein